MKRFDIVHALELLAAIALGLLILLAIGVAVRALAPVLLLFTLALVLAFLLQPFVSLCERRLRIPRPVGVLIAYLVVAAGLTLLGVLLVPPLLDQARELVGLSISLVRKLTDPSSPWYAAAERAGLAVAMAQGVAALTAQLQGLADDIARAAFVFARDLGMGLVELLLLFVVGYYMLTSRARLEAILPWLNPAQKAAISRIEPEVATTLARYLRARLFLSVLVGALFGLAAYLIGLPYPIILGTLAGVLELIPFLGPVLGAVPAVLIAAVEGPIWRVGAVLVAFVLIQQFEGNILAPKITAEAVRLHPLVVIFAVLAGSQIAGIWGALLATPILGCAATAVREARSQLAVPPDQHAAEASQPPDKQPTGWPHGQKPPGSAAA